MWRGLRACRGRVGGLAPAASHCSPPQRWASSAAATHEGAARRLPWSAAANAGGEGDASNSPTGWGAALGCVALSAVALGGVARAEAPQDRAEGKGELQAVAGAVSNDHTAKWRLFTDQARDMAAQQRYGEALGWLKRALEEAKLGFGARASHVAAALNNLAELHRVQRNYADAEPLYLEALAILDETLGRKHPSTAAALHNLGGFYLLQHDYKRAQELYEQALEVKEAALGRNHPEYATSLFHLAEVVKLQGRLEDATALLRQSLEIMEQAGMTETAAGLRRWGRLAQALVEGGLCGEAEGVQRRILQMVETVRGAASPETATAIENLAGSVEHQRRWAEARELLQRALDIRRAASGARPDNPGTGRTLRRLAKVSLEAGLDGAPGFPERATSLQQAHDLAQMANHIALQEVQRTQTACRQATPRPPPRLMTAAAQAALDAAQVRQLLAAVCTHQGTASHAVEHLRAALRILSDGAVGENFRGSKPVREETVKCMRQLADLLDQTGEKDEAKRMRAGVSDLEAVAVANKK